MTRDIAAQLIKAIIASGKSANELARLSGVPQTTISRFLAGKDMGIRKAAKIAIVLGIELKRLK